jgi:triphosphoribosyl-dephospho-CoA synthetase
MTLPVTASATRVVPDLEGPPLSADALAQDVVFALTAEAVTWPKPGLVTARTSGCHRDMDVYTMLRSAVCLGDAFRDAAEYGRQAAVRGEPCDFPQLQAIGVQGEQRMTDVTGGVNTHRGAIFFGVLLAAVAAGLPRANLTSPALLCAAASAVARPHLERAWTDAAHRPMESLTTGLRVCLRFGVGGARGEAAAGFPRVLGHGLPALALARRQGADEQTALAHTLVSLMAVVEDSTVFNRGEDPARLRLVRAGAAGVLDAGSVFTTRGRRLLTVLDQKLIDASISPGGAADLTAVSYYLHLWSERATRSVTTGARGRPGSHSGRRRAHDRRMRDNP